MMMMMMMMNLAKVVAPVDVIGNHESSMIITTSIIKASGYS
jgi:hypothetical protein